jgi:hypothetical protein
MLKMDPLELNKDAETAEVQSNAELQEEVIEQQDAEVVNPVTLQETAETEPEVVAEADIAAEVEIATEVEAVAESEVVAVADIVADDEIAAEVEAVAETEVVEEAPTVQTPSADAYPLYTPSELVSTLRELLEGDVSALRDHVEIIKQTFYKKHKAAVEEARKLFLEEGGEENTFVPEKDPLEEEFKALLNEYKVKRASLQAREDSERENNLLQKQHILERMDVLVKSNDDVSAHVNEFRELQKKWKSIGQVPSVHVNELWKSYSAMQDSFWDLIKINNELREYDFRKNYEAKILICETAEKLAEDNDIVGSFRQLQKLHDEWRELGPVSREHREEIWERFKQASSIINRKHQSHFDEIRKLEDDNLVAKTALCEKIEALDFSSLNTYKAWDEATQTIMSWQEEWRSIGFAPRKANHRIFERYRAACDAFFNAKAAFYKEAKNTLNDNLEKKKALCEKAEALKDSTDWKETADELIKLQKEWKMIGPVVKRYSDEVWKRFIAACDYFFEQKQKNSSDQRSVESENLSKKKALIAKIKALNEPEITNPQEVLATLRNFISEWNEIGFVPFREKDKIYKEYRSAVDQMFEVLNVDANQRRLDTFKTNLRDMSSKGENKLIREREKLVRAYEHLKSEIATYENNIGFLTAKNKKGSGVIHDMERKIESLKEEAALIEQKISLIEENL